MDEAAAIEATVPMSTLAGSSIDIYDNDHNNGTTVGRGPVANGQTSPHNNGTTASSSIAYPRDRLDVHVEKAIAAFKASNSWASFVTSVRGRGDLHPGVEDLPHPTAHLLSRFQKSGTPAMMKTKPWSTERIDDTLKRGPHQSSHRNIEFLREGIC